MVLSPIEDVEVVVIQRGNSDDSNQHKQNQKRTRFPERGRQVRDYVRSADLSPSVRHHQ